MLAGLGGVAAWGGAELELMEVPPENECLYYPRAGKVRRGRIGTTLSDHDPDPLRSPDA
jgi:uncharacterized protein (DUF2249 family)